jgi:alkanesulfonate monooxygenase SsuD/methylene tetrahydromethanopterin reductase-like flavin-dependent oxidoreductase (luciferase family)
MRIGIVFPQTEFGNDPAAIRDYAQTAEGLGFTHIVAYDHVLGANPNRPGRWKGPYTHESPFHEPFVLFSFMAALTQKIEFVPGVIILPQRQTALVAKQAAALVAHHPGRGAEPPARPAPHPGLVRRDGGRRAAPCGAFRRRLAHQPPHA